ncbi:hypothetical protein PXK00_10610 [Phaeobacter sp. QD34_3]|uniref:RSP_7527 family protein n=1 Tax=unclassified Phaeobacter TaxID=2621772 RepID=UPI00237F2531|nr:MULTISPECIES: hypothetical protein [unclassified Phaeobacter]MDE4133567.1 hypothetical protein [Phaeobacter sp. QD34_3]MDE4137203.1 hypothetical protein [Phaeobacter sp. QD34_24]MDE4174027.1 hypothetical protein [Phaeobacter sp. PT47_59]
MTHSDIPSLSAEDIQAIERRAQAMRSQAMATFLRAGSAAIVTAAQKLAALVLRPRHA